MKRERSLSLVLSLIILMTAAGAAEPLRFDLKSVRNGACSEASTWQPARVPQEGDRVLVSRQTRILYDADNSARIRLLQVAGALSFARDRNTSLNVGVLKCKTASAVPRTVFAVIFMP